MGPLVGIGTTPGAGGALFLVSVLPLGTIIHLLGLSPGVFMPDGGLPGCRNPPAALEYIVGDTLGFGLGTTIGLGGVGVGSGD
jgi:hypothetical protein